MALMQARELSNPCVQSRLFERQYNCKQMVKNIKVANIMNEITSGIVILSFLVCLTFSLSNMDPVLQVATN